MNKTLLIIFFAIFFLSCKEDRIFIYSPDRSQCITVVTNGLERFIIDGEKYSIPNSNYLRIKHDLCYGNSLRVCWKNNDYNWEVNVENAVVLENELDNKLYKFTTVLDRDERGIPNELRFWQEGCAVILMDQARPSPNTGAIVKKH